MLHFRRKFDGNIFRYENKLIYVLYETKKNLLNFYSICATVTDTLADNLE